MTVLLAEVTLPFTTNLPRDVAINSLHFETVDAWNDSDILAITGMVDRFWNHAFTDTGGDLDSFPLAAFLLSPLVARGATAGRIKFYDAAASDKVLLAQTNFPIEDALSGNPLPNELAICLSLTSNEASGVIPQRSRRGRVYLGPLQSTGLGGMTVGDLDEYPSVSTAARLQIAAAADDMATTAGVPAWSIWSPTRSASFAVSGGFIDNELDTQRRRQVRATARTTWGVAFV